MMGFKRFLCLSVVAFLIVSLSSCRAADLVSMSRLDKGELSVRDKFGNQTKVPNPADFLKALKEAKAVADPKDQGKTVKTDYVFLADTGTVYYDDDGKYLVYTDSSQKRHVFQADLGALIAKLPSLPPKVTAGKNLDQKLSPLFSALSKTPDPWAAAFESAGRQVLMVTAGERSTAGYTLDLEKVSLNKDGTLALTVRLTAPSGSAAAMWINYPYLELAFAGAMEADVRLVYATSSGDQVDHVSLTKVKDGQNIIPVRPERGSLLTERVRISGFVKAPAGAATVEVAVEDGHNVLGKKTVSVGAASPDWAFFEAQMDLLQASNPYGSVILRSTIAGKAEEVIVPVSFGGK